MMMEDIEIDFESRSIRIKQCLLTIYLQTFYKSSISDIKSITIQNTHFPLHDSSLTQFFCKIFCIDYLALISHKFTESYEMIFNKIHY